MNSAAAVKMELPKAFCIEFPSKTFGVHPGLIPDKWKFRIKPDYFGFIAYGDTRKEAWLNANRKLT